MFTIDADGKAHKCDLGKIMEEMKEEASHIKVEGDFIVLDFVYDYSIHKDRRDTKAKILQWVHHLAEKNWMNQYRLRIFINVACGDIGEEVYIF